MNVFVNLSQLEQIKSYNAIFIALLKHEFLSTFYYVAPVSLFLSFFFFHQKYVRRNFQKTLKEGNGNISAFPKQNFPIQFSEEQC